MKSQQANKFLAMAKLCRAKRIYKQCIRSGHHEIATRIQTKYNLV